MSQTVKDLLERIQQLPEVDRLELEEQLARLAESDWQREAADARRIVRQKGIDQAVIDAAVEQVRYGS